MKNKLYLRTGAAAALLFYTAGSASAHVKWFITNEAFLVHNLHRGPVYGLFAAPVLAWLALAAGILIAGHYLNALLPEPTRLSAFALKNEKNILLVFQALIGLFLVYIGLTRNIILEPALVAASPVTRLLQVVEIGTGLLLLTNTAPYAGAVLLLALYLAGAMLDGWVFLLENFILVGAAAYIYVGNCPGVVCGILKPHALRFLRISAGISLVGLAFTDKLLYPELAYSFLNEHHWNFMQLMGLTGFTDQFFILCAGVTELIFGLVFILGYVTRLNALVMTSFFAASVVAMGIGSGRWEVEDLPVYAVALILVLYGAGRKAPAAPRWLNKPFERPGPLKTAAEFGGAWYGKYLK